MSTPVPSAPLYRRKFDYMPYLLLAPALILILLITVFPLSYAIQLSLTNANLMEIDEMKFIGMRNYLKAFDDSIFLDSIWRTIRYIIAVAVGQMLLSLPIAMFLNIPFKGRGFTRAALLIPWVVPGAAIAIMWRSMFDYNYGIINDLLVRLAFIPTPVAWVGEPDAAFWIIVSASYWASTPFVSLTLLAVLQSISPELYEAAKVDGANAFDRFRYITFPMLLPTILLLFLLRTIGLAHGIDFIYLISMGGPGYSNYTLAVYSFLLTNRLQIGYPSAIAIMLGIVLIALSALYLFLIEKSKEWM